MHLAAPQPGPRGAPAIRVIGPRPGRPEPGPSPLTRPTGYGYGSEPGETPSRAGTRGGRARMSEATAGRPAIRVFLLDDHEIVRRGVRELLETEPDIEVI